MAATTDAASADSEFLDTVEGEIIFFRSLMKARPVGMHRHFHVLAIRNSILKDTGRAIPMEEIWKKLRTCYDIDALENLETEGYDSPGSSQSTPHIIRSPSPSENLFAHPFFRMEYQLPSDESFESLISVRRMRETASVPSSPPATSPKQPSHPRRTRNAKRGRSKLDMAGLVGGDSDSSALTMESGDEGVAHTPRGSIITGTDAGTEYAEEEEPEIQELSPASATSKAKGRLSKPPTKASMAGRTRAASTSMTRASKKRKR